MRGLAEELTAQGSDKATWHNYAPFYEERLGALAREIAEGSLPAGALRILEVGSGNAALMGGGDPQYRAGSSARAFRNCFGAEVVTVDLDPEASQNDQGPGVLALVGDAYTDAVEEMIAAHGPFAMAIDDGSHWLRDQLDFVRRYRKMMTAGGVLAVEDVPHQAMEMLLAAFGGEVYYGGRKNKGDDRIWWLQC